MGKIRYICTICANGFTTKSAALRHLKNIEQGKGMVVTEANYRTGLATGLFYPVFMDKPPKYKKTESPSAPGMSTKKPIEEQEEYIRGFWRRAGELVCEEAFRDENKRKIIKMKIDIFLLNDINRTMTNIKSSSSSESSDI